LLTDVKESNKIHTLYLVPYYQYIIVQLLLQYADFAVTPMPALTKFVFVVFAILVPILLLNMLIAMFVTTYDQIISRSEKEWKRQVCENKSIYKNSIL